VAAFGQNPFPRRFGGGVRPRQAERVALQEQAKANGFDVSADTVTAAECFAYGNAIGGIWELNERLRGAEIPARMLETLQTYETILRLRPRTSETDVARRQAVEASLRGLAGAARADVEAAISRLLGPQYDGVVTVALADEVVYWPGINPGPPGLEWSSNRCTLGVKVRRQGIGDADYERLIGRLRLLLQGYVPSWMTFTIGSGGGFIVDVSIVDVDFV
jgi:hypothetical protein